MTPRRPRKGATASKGATTWRGVPTLQADEVADDERGDAVAVAADGLQRERGRVSLLQAREGAIDVAEAEPLPRRA